MSILEVFNEGKLRLSCGIIYCETVNKRRKRWDKNI